MYKVSLLLLLISCSVKCQNVSVKTSQPTAESIEETRSNFWDNPPPFVNWTNDFEGVFSSEQEDALNKIIADFEKETTIEIAILTIDSVNVSAEKFRKLSLHIARTWRVGKKGKDNGLLIMYSTGHRKIEIQNGNGIEKMITDEETKQVIEVMVPDFKKGDYYSGTLKGLQTMIKLLTSRIPGSAKDNLDAWAYSIDESYRGNKSGTNKPIGLLTFTRTEGIEIASKKSIKNSLWFPRMTFEIYHRSQLNYAEKLSVNTRLVSSCVSPDVGGDIIIVGEFVFVNSDVCISCRNLDNNADLCRPVINYVFSKVDRKKIESIRSIIEQFIIRRLE